MTRVLLTGAGFSRNWGGWLANEAFEYLLGCKELDDQIRERLWKSKLNGAGFEDAISELQAESARDKNPNTERQLNAITTAIVGMFNAMDQAFARTRFEPQPHVPYMVRTFLVQFDAIFTLNQDLLLERHYLDALPSPGRWNNSQSPGLKFVNPNPHIVDPNQSKVALRTPDPSAFRQDPRVQPYYKLHGSVNWVLDPGPRLLIMGGNKAHDIKQYPLLVWYHDRFREFLTGPDVRLVVIGYSFSDFHINEVIGEAADRGSIKIFIIDPNGVDVLDKRNPRAQIPPRPELLLRLYRRIVGASRRPLTTTFNDDRVEHSKIMEFMRD